MKLKNLCVLFLCIGCTAFGMEFEEGKESEDGINNYKSDTDEEEIESISLDNITHLVSGFYFTEENSYDQYKIFIKPALDNKNIHSEVYRVAGKAVAFINYAIYKPWHGQGQKGSIYHLAVHKNYRGLGYGKALVKNALKTFATQAIRGQRAQNLDEKSCAK